MVLPFAIVPLAFHPPQVERDDAVLEVVSNEALETEEHDGQSSHYDPDVEGALKVLQPQRNPLSASLPWKLFQVSKNYRNSFMRFLKRFRLETLVMLSRHFIPNTSNKP